MSKSYRTLQKLLDENMNRLDENNSISLVSLEKTLNFYNKNLWLRALVHLSYFMYFTYLVYHRYDMIGVHSRGIFFWLFCGFHVISYYFIFYYLIPKYFFQKQYLYFFLIFFIWYFIPFSYFSFKYNEELELLNDYNKQNWMNVNRIWMGVYNKYGLFGHLVSFNFVQNVLHEFTSMFFLLGFFKVLKYYLDNLFNEIKLNKLNFQLEAKYLQHQLNPHFLFNSLNNIYGLILQKNKDTTLIINQFQSLLNHSLQQSDARKISLKTEIDYLVNYMNLEKIRHGSNLKITQNFDFDESKDIIISPRILQPFAENAFKHGADLSLDKAYIDIDLKVVKDSIEVNIKNSKPLLVAKKENIGGIGLKNIKRRLALLYPDHNLIITNDESTYAVYLSFKYEK